jgi:NlpC/P60 family putative phage cell wall peptidase
MVVVVDYSSLSDVKWRTRIIDITQSWLGTPYHHQASVKQVGTDCFGLVRGVWRELYDVPSDPENIPPYSFDWAEAKDEETMLLAAKRHMIEVPLEDARGGDVLVFRYRIGYNAKHAAILIGGGKMIHAISGAKTCEVHLNDWWLRHVGGAFSFPRRTI